MLGQRRRRWPNIKTHTAIGKLEEMQTVFICLWYLKIQSSCNEYEASYYGKWKQFSRYHNLITVVRVVVWRIEVYCYYHDYCC